MENSDLQPRRQKTQAHMVASGTVNHPAVCSGSCARVAIYVTTNYMLTVLFLLSFPIGTTLLGEKHL